MKTLSELREIKQKIIQDYIENKMSQRQIAKRYNTYQVLIQKILKENNIKARKNTDANRKYYLNYNYFDIIDTPNKAYILGFLYADGANNQKHNTIKLALQDTDKEILEKIRKEIKIERPLGFYNRHDKNTNWKNVYELIMQNSHLCEVLNNYGMTPNKSLTLQFPNWLREDLYSHFIRGYFDGDGHIGKIGRGAKCTFVSSFDFCVGLSNYFLKILSLAKQKVIHAKTNELTGILASTDKKSVKMIMDYIYKDCNDNKVLFMKRKYDIYLKKFYPEPLTQDEDDD